MSRLTWLHISDWHHGDFGIDPEVVRDELIKDIQGRLSISPDLSKIDFIVFSGDAALNGKAKEYEDAKKEFFVPILEASQVEPDRLFIVPGNHDLDKDEIEKLPDDFRKDVVSKEDADRWLKDDSTRELLLRPFKDFRSFVSGFTGQDSPDYSDLRTWEIDGKTVSLLGINSSWFCRRHVDAAGKKNDYGFARVGERQVHRPLERISKSDLRIAVLHHSQDWLEYSDGRVVWRRLRRGCNFILHGHGHVPEVTAERGTGGDCVIIPAGASFGGRPPEDPSRINSYNFVNIDFETGKGFVFLRRWIDERSVWDKDIQTYPEGKFPFDLPGHSTVPHQIPPPPRDFIGRSGELDLLLDGFDKGATITGLRGMGGIGKSALAYVLADRLRDRFLDGQLFLDMLGTSKSPLDSKDAMAHVIRSYLGADASLPEKLNELSGLYRTVLSGKKALILLDNAAGREQVEPLIPPNSCSLLVTSRNKFVLPGLAEKDLDVLPLDDAKNLLLEICERIGDHAEELAKLCGCLPIALRNAASPLREKPNLSVANYIKRLGDVRERLDLVEASFSLSYDLLTPELQRLWSMLSVFPADFDLAGAAAVWEMEEMPAEDALGELIRWSLVDFLPSATGEGGRYRLHDLARDFAGSRLDAAERELARLRHAGHYRDVLSLAQKFFVQGKEGTMRGLQLFDLERANILAGQSRAEKNLDGGASAAIDLCKSYPDAGVYVLDLRLSPREKIPWFETGLKACRRSNDRLAEGYHLGNLGNAYSHLGDPRKAIDFYEEALAISREIGDRWGEGADLGNLGLAYFNLGDPRKAIDFHEKALNISREIGDRRGEGNRLGNLGLAYSDLGDPRKAIDFYEEALAISREIGDRRGEGNRLGMLGLAYSDLGDHRKAIDFYEKALAISREIGDRRGEGNSLGNLGLAYFDLCDPRKAIDFHEQALAISREIGDRRGEGADLGNLGLAYFDLCDPRKAIEFYEQALAISREIGDRRGEGNHLFNMSLSLHSLGQNEKAVSLARSALAIFEEIESPHAETVRKQLAEWSG